MAAKGGPLASISIAGRTFPVTQDSDPPRDIGGNQNDVEMNGDKTARVVTEVVPSKIGPVAIQIDDDNGDQEFIQSIKDDGVLVDCSAEYVTGAIYYGQMIVADATEFSPKSSTMEVTLKGEGLTKQ
jgi:hypothetical protein